MYMNSITSILCILDLRTTFPFCNWATLDYIGNVRQPTMVGLCYSKRRASVTLMVSLMFELIAINNQKNGLARLLGASKYGDFSPSSNTSLAKVPSISAAASTSVRESIQRRVLNVQDQSIRSWGCNMTATPFLFVHIGKAGGGNVRRRIATAALNFTRNPDQWFMPHLDQHYYPVRKSNGKAVHRAVLCNSGRSRHFPMSTHTLFYEGYSQRCTATTPVGRILACPEIFGRSCHPQDPLDPNSAHIVYMGHNYLGTELHWLPIPFLNDWWDEHWRIHGMDKNDAFSNKLSTIDGIQPRCRNFSRPLGAFNSYHPEWYEKYYDCAQQHLEPAADQLDADTRQQHFPIRDEKDIPIIQGRAWGQMYASLPVTRVTVLREPMSWLRSKYAWHKIGKIHNYTCDDIATATDLETYTDLHDAIRPGWVRKLALQYIFYLCGEDCHTRMELGKATLPEIESQAAYNLRHSFAVVGLLEDQDTFFEMIHARVDYMDMHLITNVTDDGTHKSNADLHCSARFKDPQFQQVLIAASPELASLMRLYEIGVEVNRFQRQELQQCSGTPLAAPTTG